jgi:hypothetical protein
MPIKVQLFKVLPNIYAAHLRLVSKVSLFLTIAIAILQYLVELPHLLILPTVILYGLSMGAISIYYRVEQIGELVFSQSSILIESTEGTAEYSVEQLSNSKFVLNQKTKKSTNRFIPDRKGANNLFWPDSQVPYWNYRFKLINEQDYYLIRQQIETWKSVFKNISTNW